MTTTADLSGMLQDPLPDGQGSDCQQNPDRQGGDATGMLEPSPH